ncbi:hypothetical protein [Alteromonas macleodii]|uniref:Uncharacterized protein n=1 Tax=Alteromonas macleodii TaxID=28108 RepID=A0AB36FLR1_ALTMA|nr:hypothetical protein [Alteromonas macleodii]OES24690.1 hypothetical protein BFV93_4707 [Alteromonas macleodii]OES25793.1 hypothetical protein BFV94_4319 [Alteromonas macleodii]OES25874.1 hypothetical protein BFV95_4262 [Alteromonas macleodii]OES38974.1 hypothetical protein BFV96_4468 [Alteromonas macleodii]
MQIAQQLEMQLDNSGYPGLLAKATYTVNDLIRQCDKLDDATLQVFLNVATQEALNANPQLNSDRLQHDIILGVHA